MAILSNSYTVKYDSVPYYETRAPYFTSWGDLNLNGWLNVSSFWRNTQRRTEVDVSHMLISAP